MKTCGIYGFRNMVNGKWSIGQSGDIKRRKAVHFSCLRRGIHYNQHLQAAFKKYGEANFEFRIIEEVSEALLDFYERTWIAHYKSDQPEFGYNLESGGHLYKHHSAETRLKISAAEQGKRNSAEHRRKISVALKGRPLSDAMYAGLKKWREANKGKPLSDAQLEHLKKIGNANKGRILSVEHRKKISEANKGKTYFKGCHHSLKSRHKMSVASKRIILTKKRKHVISKSQKRSMWLFQ